jgi:hypothetical protein
MHNPQTTCHFVKDGALDSRWVTAPGDLQLRPRCRRQMGGKMPLDGGYAQGILQYRHCHITELSPFRTAVAPDCYTPSTTRCPPR